MFNEVFNLCCDLEHSEAMFSQDSLPYDVPAERWSKRISSSAIPSLVTKGSAVQNNQTTKISSKQPLKFWPFTMTLTLSTATQKFHWTSWFILIYHQTKFDCKRITGSEDIAKTVIFDCISSHWDLNKATQFSLFVFCMTLQLMVMLSKVERIRRYPDKQLKVWTFAVTSTSNRAIQYFHQTL